MAARHRWPPDSAIPAAPPVQQGAAFGHPPQQQQHHGTSQWQAALQAERDAQAAMARSHSARSAARRRTISILTAGGAPHTPDASDACLA